MSIKVRNLTKSFGNLKVLDNINLNIPSRELVALLGPSGSGKTTLLRIVAGLEYPDSGSVHFFDEDATDRHVRNRDVGFVFQHYALFRHMTVFENIAFGLTVKKRKERPPKSEIKERVYELLKLIQLESLANRYPNQLSGGQRQRVALARALATDPKVLLLDEPFGALDAKVRQELRRWLRRLHEDMHITSLFVTHDQEEALEVADRIVVTNNSRIEQVGTPDEVFHNPANEFVMHFLGDVNVFHERFEKDTGNNKQTLRSDDKKEDCLFVRPHDIRISDRAVDGSTPAKVSRVLTAGPFVKVELLDMFDRYIHVHLSHSEYAVSPVYTGDRVYILPKKGKMLDEDNKLMGFNI